MLDHHIQINPLLYYKKQMLNNENGPQQDDSPPLQIINPSGDTALGVPHVPAAEVIPEYTSYEVPCFLISGPESNKDDSGTRANITISFLIVAFINFVLTIVLFSLTDVDSSKVVIPSGIGVGEFDRIDKNPMGNEVTSYAFVLGTICLGMFSMLLESPFGITLYITSTVINGMLGMTSIPYFVYSLRYFLDAVMLYFAMSLRSKLVYVYLPLSRYQP